ncbi:MAG: D-alanine--D-alanine ligase [Xanthomonadales bacterium]
MMTVPPLKTYDPETFGRVGLVIGGDSAEREVSLNGGRAVEAALRRKGVDVTVFDGAPALFEAIGAGRIDRVFNLIHGPGGEDGSLQGALQLMKVPVTGSDLPSSALTMDKIRSKWVWERNGLLTPPFEAFGRTETDFSRALDTLRLPYFVKPNGLGSSIGISKVRAADELVAAVELARRYSDTVLVEQEVRGREFFAGVIGRLALPLIRIETPHDFYDYEAKYTADDTRYFCPCGLDAALEGELQSQSLRAFDLLGASGWGRVDFLLDDDARPWFLEVNTTPGMTGHSLVPQAAAQVGIDFDDLVWRILESSL